MPPGDLNVEAVRSRALPGLPPSGAPRRPVAHRGLSRRQLFGAAGVAAVGAGLPLRSLIPAAAGTVEVVEGPGRVEFRVGGLPRWIVDVARFAGRPRLTLERGAHTLRLRLEHARYPGTGIPADFRCLVTEAEDGGRVALHMAAGGWEGHAPWVRWLEGRAELAGAAALHGLRSSLGGAAQLVLAGSGRATFRPDWTLRFTGASVAHVSGLGAQPLTADAVSAGLLSPDAPSALVSPPDRRSLITLAPGTHGWDLLQDLPTGGAGTLGGDPGAFEALRLEVGETTGGAPAAALIAESAPGARIRFLPRAGIFELPLRALRYVAALRPGGHQRAVVGEVDAQPTWLHHGGCGLLLGGGGFELQAQGDRLERLDCAPAILAVAAPLQGAVVRVLSPGAGSATLAFGPQERAAVSGPPAGAVLRDVPGSGPVVQISDLTVSVLRPEDLLELTFEFVNLDLQTGSGGTPQLVRRDGTSPAYVIVHFPPQHVAEQAFFEAASTSDPANEPPTAPPVKSRLAGPSRLAFLVPDGVSTIPYTLQALLGWEAWQQSVPATAAPPPLPPAAYQVAATASGVSGLRPFVPMRAVQRTPGPGTGGTVHVGPSGPPPIQAPAGTETAIEAPYRLILSPHDGAAWAHSTAPVTSGARTELWHTRLAVRVQNADGSAAVDEADARLRTVRAVWSPDYRPDPQAPIGIVTPFTTSLDSTDRNQFVHLTADLGLAYGAPVQVDRLMLTAVGAWMDLMGAWSPPLGAPLDRQGWTQRATMGRDQFVRVVTGGVLFPFGHAASVVKVTERKVERTPAGDLAAYLRQYLFIVVRQPEKDYPTQGRRGRQIPYRSVRITTLVTPHLDPFDETQPFWPQVGGVDFPFGIVAADWDGQSSQFTAPLQFIPDSLALDRGVLSQAVSDYQSAPGRARRELGGQKVAYAASRNPGDTTFSTQAVTFGAEVAGPNEVLAEGQPAFFPLVAQAEVYLGAPAQFGAPNPTTAIGLADAYLQQGFDPVQNAGEAFAQMTSPLGLGFGDLQKVGGIVNPAMSVTGLSRQFGPVAAQDLTQFAQGHFDPADLFPDAAKLLGGISLSGIARVVQGFVSGETRVPGMKARVVYRKNSSGQEDPALGPAALQVDWNWKPEVQSFPQGAPVFQADRGGSPAALQVSAQVYAPVDGSPATYKVDGRLTDFTVNLIPPGPTFLIVAFRELHFSSQSGQKPQVHPDVDTVQFAGPLTFVNALEQFLSSSAFGGGVSLDVSPSGVTAAMKLAVPTLAIGVMSLENLSISSKLNLPFTGDPVRLRIGISERDHPFVLTVSLFGGGGYFAMALGLDGVESLEAALEFGGSLSLDLGVASGGVQVMAGIYYHMTQTAELAGFLRCGGSLQVLGVVTVTVEFDMELAYETAHNKVWGQASLTVDVSIAFFSAGVTLTVRREFAGSGNDPTFEDLMGPDAALPSGYPNYWAVYADAFA